MIDNDNLQKKLHLAEWISKRNAIFWRDVPTDDAVCIALLSGFPIEIKTKIRYLII